MTEARPFAELMTYLRQGDEEAAEVVWRRFAHRLRALAATRLPEQIRPKVDPDDIVQSVFRSFFARHADGRFELESWDSLWTLLTVLTVRKCGHKAEYFRAGRRDVQRESRLESGSESEHAGDVAAPDPTPAEAALLAETLRELLSGLREEYRPIVLLRLQGYTPAEISAQIGCTERTVTRVLRGVRMRLERPAKDD